MSMYLTGLIGVALIVRISQPINALRGALLVSVVAMLLGGSILFPKFFQLAPITGQMAMFMIFMSIGALALFVYMYERLNKQEDSNDIVSRMVVKLGRK